jgi:hypothetical protein
LKKSMRTKQLIQPQSNDAHALDIRTDENM